jgi:hypothetical protein
MRDHSVSRPRTHSPDQAANSITRRGVGALSSLVAAGLGDSAARGRPERQPIAAAAAPTARLPTAAHA